MKPTRSIYCVCGSPFSGKSTAANELARRLGGTVVTAEEIGRIALIQKPHVLDAPDEEPTAAKAPEAEPDDADADEASAEDAEADNNEGETDFDDEDQVVAWCDDTNDRLPYPEAARVDCERPKAFLHALSGLLRRQGRHGPMIIDGIRGRGTLRLLKENGAPVHIVSILTPYGLRESLFNAHGGTALANASTGKQNGTPYAQIAEYAIESDQVLLPLEADVWIPNDGTLAEFRKRFATAIHKNGRITPLAITSCVLCGNAANPDHGFITDAPLCTPCAEEHVRQIACGTCGNVRDICDRDAQNKPRCSPCSIANAKEPKCADCGTPFTGKKYFSRKRQGAICEHCYETCKDDETDFEQCNFCGSYEYKIVRRGGGLMCSNCHIPRWRQRFTQKALTRP